MDASYFRANPTKVFENAKDGVTQIYTAGGVFAVANNQSVIAAVTGQRIRIMGLTFVSDDAAAASNFLLKSASGGTTIMPAMSGAPDITAPFNLPLVYSGYAETNTGEGLFIDVGTQALRIWVFYLVYTP